MLSLIQTIDTNNNKQQENAKFSNRTYRIQDMKYVQHKNVDMTWDYQKSFLGSQLLQKSLKLGEEIIFFYVIITGLIHNLVKVFVRFIEFHVHIQPVLLNLINIGYQLFPHHINQSMPMLKTFTITKYLNITMIGSSWYSWTKRHYKLSFTTVVNWFFREFQLRRQNSLKWIGVVL